MRASHPAALHTSAGYPQEQRASARRACKNTGTTEMKTKRELEEQITSAQAAIDALIAELAIVRARNAHLEVELAQARVSRDGYAQKYKAVSDWMKEHVSILKQ